jgi:MFS family permease
VVLLQPIFVSPATWIALRMAFGVCAAGVYTVIESWLNERATNETRGRILSAYVFVNFGALMLGQWILTAASPKGFELFSLAAILCAVGTVPVAVTRLPQPAPSAVPGFRILELAENAPVGIAGVVAAGLANAAVWVLAPVYALSLGFSTTGVALFMCAFTLGGALIQLPLGRFSDRCDRRWIIAGMSAAAAIGGIALAIFSSHARGAPWALYALAFFFGAAILPLYSLSIAHANDRIERTKFVQASATLLMINALAAVAGPSIAAVVTLYAGRSSLFLYTAAIHVAISGFAIWRSSAKRAVGADQREQFVAVPQPSSPNSFELDPRAP